MTTKVPYKMGTNPAVEDGHKRKMMACDGRDYGSTKAYPNPALGTNEGSAHGGVWENKIRREQDSKQTKPKTVYRASNYK